MIVGLFIKWYEMAVGLCLRLSVRFLNTQGLFLVIFWIQPTKDESPGSFGIFV